MRPRTPTRSLPRAALSQTHICDSHSLKRRTTSRSPRSVHAPEVEYIKTLQASINQTARLTEVRPGDYLYRLAFSTRVRPGLRICHTPVNLSQFNYSKYTALGW